MHDAEWYSACIMVLWRALWRGEEQCFFALSLPFLSCEVQSQPECFLFFSPFLDVSKMLIAYSSVERVCQCYLITYSSRVPPFSAQINNGVLVFWSPSRQKLCIHRRVLPWTISQAVSDVITGWKNPSSVVCLLTLSRCRMNLIYAWLSISVRCLYSFPGSGHTNFVCGIITPTNSWFACLCPPFISPPCHFSKGTNLPPEYSNVF